MFDPWRAAILLDDARGWRLAEMRKRRGMTQEQAWNAQASCRASWNRRPSVRSSSGPAFLPRASGTARIAAVHSGVRSPRITPAPPNVVPS